MLDETIIIFNNIDGISPKDICIKSIKSYYQYYIMNKKLNKFMFFINIILGIKIEDISNW
jgi:hypothetical protein